MTVLNLQVSASADDANEIGTGAVTLTASPLSFNNANQFCGIRFLNATIPVGSTINTAVLSLNVQSTSFDDPAFDVYGDDQDNAGTFTITTNDISARPRTTATATITAVNVGTGYYALPSVAAMVQEIVNRGGWASGNALSFILDCLVGVNFRFISYDGTPASAAILAIDYTAPAGGGAGSKVRSVRLFSKVGGVLT